MTVLLTITRDLPLRNIFLTRFMQVPVLARVSHSPLFMPRLLLLLEQRQTTKTHHKLDQASPPPIYYHLDNFDCPTTPHRFCSRPRNYDDVDRCSIVTAICRKWASPHGMGEFLLKL